MTSSLSGLRILDLSRFIAGPHCCQILGDLGADVVKVERAKLGDDSRSLAPFAHGESLYFLMMNRNKRSLTLNFRDPVAQDLLRRLVAETDVLVENFRPGTMEKMKCGWDELRSINPRLIMARLSGYGQSNSMTENPCFDGIAQALSGIMDLTGEPERGPMMAGTFLVDYTTGLHAAIGVLAALERRRVTNQGQVVDVSLMGSAASLLMTAIPDYLLNGRTMTRMGNRDRYAAPANTFRTCDGAWVHMTAGTNAHFPRFARMIGRPDLLEDPRFATLEARMANVDAAEAIAAEWVGSHAADKVIVALQQAEIPCAKVRNVAEVVNDPYMREAGHIVDVPHPLIGALPMQGPPIQLTESPTSVSRPPPLLGEHTDEVLTGWLGLKPEEIAELRQRAAI